MAKQQRKTVEHKLFDAYNQGRDVRLTIEDVEELLLDAAIRTRITNAAAVEAGVHQPGTDGLRAMETWKGLKRRLHREHEFMKRLRQEEVAS